MATLIIMTFSGICGGLAALAVMLAPFVLPGWKTLPRMTAFIALSCVAGLSAYSTFRVAQIHWPGTHDDLTSFAKLVINAIDSASDNDQYSPGFVSIAPSAGAVLAVLVEVAPAVLAFIAVLQAVVARAPARRQPKVLRR